MLNFILEKDKKKIITEYFYRLTIYFLLFSFFTLIVLISLFLPSIFYSKYKSDNVSQQLLSIKDKVGENSENPTEIIIEANKFAKVFTDEKENILLSDLIQKIVSLKNKDIKILSFSLVEDVETSVKIIISGVANTRDSLTYFDKELKKDGYFQSVDLPVSNLIKNVYSDFTMTLIYKK